MMYQVLIVLALVRARELFVGRIDSSTAPRTGDRLRVDLPDGPVFLTAGEICHGRVFPQNCDVAVSIIDQGETDTAVLADRLRAAPMWRIFENTRLEGFVPPEWLDGMGLLKK